MKRMQNILSVLLIVVMIIGVLPAAEIDQSRLLVPIASADIVDSGTCGENLTWELDGNGTLTISGEGAMNDYAFYAWKNITSVVIEDGVTSIAHAAFFDCFYLSSVLFPDSLISIDSSAFKNCMSLSSVIIPKSVELINGYAFQNCSLSYAAILNPDCVFNGSNYIFRPVGTLYGYVGSTTETFAASYGIPFLDVNELGKKYLPGYVPDADEYGFVNTGKTVDLSHYFDVFGVVWGTILGLKNGNIGKGGVCYGMSATTSVFLKNKNLVQSLYLQEDQNAVQLSVLNEAKNPQNTYSIWTGTTLETYINCAHAYQLAPFVQWERDRNRDDLKALWTAVKNSVDNGSVPVLIDMYNGSYDNKSDYHTVLAVGYKEDIINNELHILIDDPNNYGICTFGLRPDFSQWIYSQAPYYSSVDGGFTFNTANVYGLGLSTGLHSLQDPIALLICAKSIISADKKIIPLWYSSGKNDENEQLYWTEEDVTTITITPDEDDTITVANNSTSFTISAKKNSALTFEYSEEKGNTMSFVALDNENEKIELMTSQDDIHLGIAKIDGIATGGTVAVTETDTGLEVSGLKSGTITITNSDGSVNATEEFVSESAYVEVSYDRTGEKELTDITIKAAGHSLTKTEEKYATCTEGGNVEYYTCSVCGKIFSDADGTEEISDVTVKAVGHKLTKTEATDATCTKEGNIEYYTCSACGKFFSNSDSSEEISDVTIKAVGHKVEIDNAVPATCVVDGMSEGSHCAVCGEVLQVQTIIKAEGHKWDLGIVAKEATIKTEGERIFTCSVCGEKKTETIPKLALPEQEKYQLGDVNNDGKVGSDDARLALRASVKLEPDIVKGTASFNAADVNHDNKIGSDDARIILRVSVKLESFT